MTFSTIKTTILALALMAFGSQAALAMDPKHSHEFHSIIMPGQNGAGGYSFKQNCIVNTPKTNFDLTNKTHRFDTLRSRIDLGQGNCIHDFDRQYQQYLKKIRPGETSQAPKKTLLFGVSQGTATLTNWLAQKTHKEQKETTELLLLEGVLGSGNRGIMHTVESAAPIVTYLPFARAWMPFLAKIFFPTYNPFGKSALSSAKKLSPELPVVIMHNKGDKQLSINDARELYCTLRESGNDNAYLIETDNGAAHFDILSPWYRQDGYPERQEKIAALQAIYKKHGLPRVQDESEPTAELLQETYQPSVQTVKDRIKATNGYKNVIRNVIDVAAGALALGAVWWKYFYKK